MKIILTDRKLKFNSKDVSVIIVNSKTVNAFDGNENVVGIVGSRKLSKICNDLNLPSLKLVQLTSAGFDGVPIDDYKQKGVAVCNAGSVYSTPIAETVVFGILLMAKKIRKNPNNRHFKIQRHYSTITELENKKALILGVGNIGGQVAKRLDGFGMLIDGYDPFVNEKKYFNKILKTRQELIQNLKEYDYIVSTLPANQSTEGFIDKQLFSTMKNSAVIINVGRKAVFNEKDFYCALKSKSIGGAVLDMFEKFPNPITNKFRRLKNTVVLPGVSAISKEVNIRLDEHIVENLAALINENPLKCVVNGVM